MSLPSSSGQHESHPHWILTSALAPYIPTGIALSIIGFLAIVHYISWTLGHTSVWVRDNNNEPDMLTFVSPPISLTGNRIPTYFIYAFGCTFFAFTIFTYAETFRITVKKYIVDRVAAINLTSSNAPADTPIHSAPQTPHSPPHPDSSEEEDLDEPSESHPAAFWRKHWRQAKSQDYTIIDKSPNNSTRPRACSQQTPYEPGPICEIETAPPPSPTWPEVHAHRKRPLLTAVAFLFSLGLVSFALQAIVPAEKDLLEKIGQQCRRVTSVENLNLVQTAGMEDPLGEIMRRRRRLGEEVADTQEERNKQVVKRIVQRKMTRRLIESHPQGEDQLVEEVSSMVQQQIQPPPLEKIPRESAIEAEVEKAIDIYVTKSSNDEPESHAIDHWLAITDRLLQAMTNRLQALLTEARPLSGPTQSDISLNPHLIYCPEIRISTVQWITLLHASAAMLFFLCIYSSMALFVLWLLLKWMKRVCRGACGRRSTRYLLRPSSLSVLLKSLLIIVPTLRPLEYVQADILRHVSMLDYAGLSQRLSVLCILLYGATLGIEIQGLRQGLRMLACSKCVVS